MTAPLLNYGSRLVSLRCSGSIVPSIRNHCFRLEGVVNVIKFTIYWCIYRKKLKGEKIINEETEMCVHSNE
jgi:hypothetical protein